MTSSAEFRARTSRALATDDVAALADALEWAGAERRRLVQLEDVARALLDCLLAQQTGTPMREERAALDAAWTRWDDAPQ